MMIEIEILPNNSEEVPIERRVTVNVHHLSLSLSCRVMNFVEREREREPMTFALLSIDTSSLFLPLSP